MRVESATSRETWVRPYVAPYMHFRIEQGTIGDKRTLECIVNPESASFGDHTDELFVLMCEDGLRLVLQDIDLQ